MNYFCDQFLLENLRNQKLKIPTFSSLLHTIRIMQICCPHIASNFVDMLQAISRPLNLGKSIPIQFEFRFGECKKNFDC